MKKAVFLIALFTSAASAQPIQLDMSVFAERREAFMKKMESNSVAIFPCKPEYLRNLDVEYEYRQESNFYYLSGYEEPEAILLVSPSALKHKFVMFVRKRDQRRETYDGPRSGTDGAMKTFRADTAYLADEFRTHVHRHLAHGGTLYYNFGINPRMDETIREMVVEKRASGNYPIADPSPILAEMRLIKNDGDLRMGMRTAVEISVKGHLEAIKSIEPGMNEAEIQAVHEFSYRRNGSPRNGYPCIVGSGANSTVLHYNKNTRVMKDGEVILMDCGAEYGYYSADITRTVPVNGKFSKEQREIYSLVLDAQNAAMRLVKPGLIKKAMDDAIDSVLGNGLVKLGFIKDKKDFRMFSLHGYSHWIGLEVHDVGNYVVEGKSRPLEAGMCFTIEPGIYVRLDVFGKMNERGYSEEEIATIRKRLEPYMSIGVRIEDDILVTENGYINMSEAVPREIDAIEKLMKQKGVGNHKP
jgi:Xaa-Pro aminopeptidase